MRRACPQALRECTRVRRSRAGTSGRAEKCRAKQAVEDSCLWVSLERRGTPLSRTMHHPVLERARKEAVVLIQADAWTTKCRLLPTRSQVTQAECLSYRSGYRRDTCG